MPRTKAAICRSQAIFWGALSAAFFLDYLVSSWLAALLLPNFIAGSLIAFLELFIFSVSITNAIYCYVSYWMSFDRNPEEIVKSQRKLKGVNSSRNISLMSNASAPARLNFSGRSVEREKHLSKVTTFLESFFASKLNTSTSDSVGFRTSSMLKDASFNSASGCHDSPLNHSVSSIYTQQQLSLLLADDEAVDTAANSSAQLFVNFCYDDHVYQAGTYIAPKEKASDAATRAEEFALFKQQQDNAVKSLGARKISDSLGRFTRESSPLALSAILGSTATTMTSSGAGGKQRRYESDLTKLYIYYGLRTSDMENYELKLRVWICNTIVRPLVQKVNEVNEQLSEKFASLHLKVGVSSLDSLKTNLSSRIELCNTYLPFLLPYLRIHNNQNYLIQRFRILSENVALENFRWNGGCTEIICDEVDGFAKSHPWSDRLPTDSELIWMAFCAYMDYHLAPCPNYGTGEFFKPFSNVYFLRADVQPTALHSAPEAFFIRMAATYPPLFEFAFNGGNDVVVPSKDSGNNLWLAIILFLAHVEKFNCSRIGHLHLSAISLDVLDK